MTARKKIFQWCSTLALFAALSLGASACSSTRSVGEQTSDAAISAKVKTKLAADPQINPFDIDVDTVSGVVTLTGEVERMVAKIEAEQLARDTDGVYRVVNRIRVVGESSGGG